MRLLGYDESPPSSRKAALPLRNTRSQLLRIDDVLVDLKQGDVIIKHLMQQDHELDQIGAGLLPEGLLPASEEIRHQRGDAKRQRVCVEIVVQRVVSVHGRKADFDVVLVTPMAVEDVAHLLAEITFDFQDESTESLTRLIRFVCEQLLNIGMDAGGCLAGADGANNCYTGV